MNPSKLKHSLVSALLLASLGGLASSASAQIEAEFKDDFDASADTESPKAAKAAKAKSSEAAREDRDAQRLRVQNTWYGPAGGFHVVDAGSGLAGTFGLQLGFDFFSSSDFLIQGDQNDYSGATLSLRISAADFLELYASMASHANYNNRENPQLLQVLGDALLGVKAFAEVLPWLTLGGDFRLSVPNTVGDIGPVMSAASFGLRGNLSADLRGLDDPTPLIFRLNLDYLFDNTANLIEGVEDQRYEALGPNSLPREDEEAHLIRRVERFALGINRVDAFTFALGAEAPLRAAEDFFIHPLVEWSIAIPVNRQNFSCLLVATDTGPEDPDGCLDVEGGSAMPSTFTLGVRVLPPLRGLSLALGLDIGVSGASTFVRELAGNKPYAVLFALSYDVDAREKVPTETREVEVVREVIKAPPKKPRVEGVVVDSATGAGVAGATVRYPEDTFTAQQTDPQGIFISYELEPGEARFEVSHPDYEPRACTVEVPKVADDKAKPEKAAAEAASADEPARVALRCELTAKPRIGGVQGTVRDAEGKPVSGATVSVSGLQSESATTSDAGQFSITTLTAGSYNARVEATGFMIKLEAFEVKPGATAALEITLTPQPKQSQVELTSKEVRIRKEIFFKTNSAEISEKSNGLLSEIADVLLRNPQVNLVEVQGHTDNTGSPEENQSLSQQRAEAVRTWLVGAGVDAARLEAKGYGDSRPLVPNLTDRHRARNRRVQFIIRGQE